MNKNGYDVVGFDLRGFGHSASNNVTWETLVEDVSLVAKNIDTSVPNFFMGYDMGCVVLLDYLLNHEKNKVTPNGIVLLSPLFKSIENKGTLRRSLSKFKGLVTPNSHVTVMSMLKDASYLTRTETAVQEFLQDK